MPIRKQRPSQKSTETNVTSSSTSQYIHQPPVPQVSSKAEQAGMLAQQLGSERSWADDFVPELPGSHVSRTNSTETPTTLQGSQRGPQQDHMGVLTPTTSHTMSIPTQASDEAGHVQPTRDVPPPTYDDVMSNTPESSIRSFNQTPNSAVVDSKPLARASTDPVRSYALQETYKSISGTFTFYDYLELSSSAGSINVVLDPQPGDVPAVLRVKAQYGSIKITVSDEYLERVEKTKSIPRPWDIEIVAHTGSIQTKLPLGRGSKCLIDSHVGSLKSTFYAATVGINDEVSELTTQSGVGSQKVEIVSFQGRVPVTNISAKHYAKSHGSLKVVYPKTWQGRLHASSGGYGSVKVSGDRMEHTRYGDKEQQSWRGEGQLIEVRCDGHGSAKIDCS